MHKQLQEKGFTLIEVLIAITLLATGILAVASMQISAIGGNSVAGRITEASTWAAGQLEQLMAKSYADADLADDNGGAGIAGLDDNTAATADGNATQGKFNIYWNIADNFLPDGTPLANIKTVRVIVNTTEKGVTKSVSFDYIVVNDT